MNYKKILAATAVTSAAIVVPAVAQAEDNVTYEISDKLFSQSAIQYGEKLIAAKELNQDGLDVKDAITKYEWSVVFTDGSTKTLKSTTNELVIPVEATESGAKIQLKATTASGKHFSQNISVTGITNDTTISIIDLSAENTPIVNEAVVNTPISLKFGFADTKTITKYEWYIYDKDTSEYVLLSDKTDMILDVPVLASGKTLVAVVKTESNDSNKSINYYRAELEVKDLVLSQKNGLSLKINDKSATNSSSLAPGDVLSLAPYTIEGNQKEIILPSQANIQYQWMFTDEDGKTSSIITDATNATFTIPNDAFYRTLQSFKVRIDIEVPDANAKTVYFSEAVKFNVADAEDLVEQIDALFNDVSTYSSDIYNIEDDVKDIQLSYSKLSENSKLLVTNYQKLQQAESDIKLVKPLSQQLQAFGELFSSYPGELSEATHAKLTKQFDSIYKSYLKLSALQRSLLGNGFDAQYVEAMNQNLKNLLVSGGVTVEEVTSINDAILDLFVDPGSFVKLYKEDLDIATFKSTINDINARIKKVDKTQQPLIYSALIKNALKDAKKAESVIAKIQVLQDTKLVGTKRTKAIVAAQKQFDKLTYVQKSLVPTSLQTVLNTAMESELTKVDELNSLINDFKNAELYTSADPDLSVAAYIKNLYNTFNSLSSADKKLIQNAATLTQANKDVLVVEKFLKSAEKAYADVMSLPEAMTEKAYISNDKKTLSKYTSVYKAYVKLTQKQKALIESFDTEYDIEADIIAEYQRLLVELNEPTEKDFEVNEETGLSKFEESKISEVKSLLQDLEEMVSANSSASVQDAITKINVIKAAYKKLTSIEKKHVDNYPILSAANSLVSKAQSVQNSLKSAIAVNTESKLTSAIAAYNKLTSAQKSLINNGDIAYGEEAESMLSNLQPDLDELESIFEGFSPENLEYLTKDVIENATAQIKNYSSKQLKTVSYYSTYQQALKDLKAVDTFVGKIDKLGPNPTYSKKQTIFDAFNKLTGAQITLLNNSSSYAQYLVILDGWKMTVNDASATLNTDIASLYEENTGKYKVSLALDGIAGLDELTTIINGYESQYKNLDSKEKKLVTHYGFLKTATKDVKAVKPVMILAEQFDEASEDEKEVIFNQWQKAYNKLTLQQQSLFDLAVKSVPYSN